MAHKYAKYGRGKPKSTNDSGGRRGRFKTTYKPGEPYGHTRYKPKKKKAAV